MATVYRRTNKETGEKESLESMISRFKKKCDKEDLIKELRKKDYYLSKTQRRKLKDKEAERVRKSAGQKRKQK